MKLPIETIVYNESTKEAGRIVRIAMCGRQSGYVVATTNRVSGRELEAFWRPKELREVRERMRKSKSVANGK